MELEFLGLTKSFKNFIANDNINIKIPSGEIRCILGENGAGKSTLMNILCGFYSPDSGVILLDGKEHRFSNPREAIKAGIGIVHQHFTLIPNFTVAENIALGQEKNKFKIFLDLESTKQKILEISQRFKFEIDPNMLVEKLSLGMRQRVEIIKALIQEAKILILDEPTAVLTPQETDELLNIMRQLKANGTTIIFISHKLREVKEISDSITIIRRGKVVGEASPRESAENLASLMVGRDVSLKIIKNPINVGKKMLEIENLVSEPESGKVTISELSFSISAGEILVFAGVDGNGQKELVETLMGTRKTISGAINLDGVSLVNKNVSQRLDEGIGLVPEDRKTEGLIESFSVADNLLLDLHNHKPYSNGISINYRKVKEFAIRKIKEFDIRCQGYNSRAKSLSGGNQQKIVVARALSRPLKLLVAAQPTRGVDVGSIEFIHKSIVEQRDNGVACMIISTELEEVLDLADRIAVLYKGKIMGIVPGNTSRHILGLMMSGTPIDSVGDNFEKQVAYSKNSIPSVSAPEMALGFTNVY